jgi:Fe-S-cluster containining protein
MTLRLAILGSSPCDRCTAACCKQNGHEYAVLLEGDERRKFAAFAVDALMAGDACSVVEKVLPYREGRCVFLGGDDRCTIYEDRPMNCRRFECVTGYHQAGADLTTHSRFLSLNPAVRRLLEVL